MFGVSLLVSYATRILLIYTIRIVRVVNPIAMPVEASFLSLVGGLTIFKGGDNPTYIQDDQCLHEIKTFRFGCSF